MNPCVCACVKHCVMKINDTWKAKSIPPFDQM
jgi:hypothetical protein